MKSKIITIASSVLFLTGIIYFASGIYKESKSGVEKTKTKFETLMLATKNAAINDKIGSQEFSTDFINAIGNFNDFSEIKLTVDDILIYSYPALGYDFSAEKPSKEFVKTFSDSELLSNIIQTASSTKENSELSLTATIFKIKQSSIYNNAKVSFILVLAGTLLSVIGLLFTNEFVEGKDKKQVKNKEKTSEDIINEIRKIRSDLNENFKTNTENTEATIASDDFEEDDDDIFDDDVEGEETISTTFEENVIFNEEVGEIGEEGNPDVIDASEIEQKEEIEIQEPSIEDIEENSEIQKEEVQQDDNETPLEMEQPKSDEPVIEENQEILNETNNENVSNEPIIEENQEILNKTVDENNKDNSNEPIIEEHQENSSENIVNNEPVIEENQQNEASSEPIIDENVEIASEKTFLKDLGDQLKENKYKEISLALIEIENFDLDKEDVKTNDIVNLIKEHFGETSETYKYNQNTISIVLNGSDLDKTISYCESILPAIKEVVANEEFEIHIGISAMNYRTIPADRIIVEAQGALSKAEEDPENPIVAFKANPERYKQAIGDEVNNENTSTENNNN